MLLTLASATGAETTFNHGIPAMLSDHQMTCLALAWGCTLSKSDNSCAAVEGIMYLAPACTFWLFLGILVLEWLAMLQEGAINLMAQNPAKFCAAAVMGFGVNGWPMLSSSCALP